ncbi:MULTISPECIES: DUF1350 family protein [unclassified Coleofasciculus]|uniref:DUF1350 family protein n=1 Tax=unclassified Coleofasciculus TaxID=2692782 RepID=UPI001882779F|nr:MULTISPECIES: DUF1350 family protein [unclassified Coleofasciculus]MBE9128039.1 DUF1350 family protein [Coleofasciculus sp. LEGE 07081]MBE9151136.1 DUF1350 family protein [Coleofasciculus sp. LEGE 07092]
MDWQELYGSWVLIPPRPTGIVHFLGGAFVATAPQLTYRWLLEQLGRQGYAVIATPFINTFDHVAIAREVLNRFETTLDRLQATTVLSKKYLPIYGVGHSMGCKLHLLIGSLFSVERAGNILISFNNYPAKRAIPFLEQLNVQERLAFLKQFNITPAFDVEFTPSPLETNELIAERYEVRRNLLIKFTNDEIDQTVSLTPILQQRFPGMVAMQTLPGNHLTPLGQDINWTTGDVFTPWDAIGQWFKQEAYRDLNLLKREIIRWLNPLLLA